MKGGLTSGVVYPRAVSLLSEHYFFKSIGGTSAGAVAAAGTAAAEYRRRPPTGTGSSDGYKRLQALPDELGKPTSSRGTLLFSVFQPAKACQRLFSVLTAALNRESAAARAIAIAIGLARAYIEITLLALFLGLGIAARGEGVVLRVVGGLAVALLVWMLGVAVYIFFDLTRNVARNGFGLCTGLKPAGKDADSPPAVTDWLHQLLQEVSDVKGKPLTFGDLWRAGGFPPDFLNLPEEVRRSSQRLRSIDLRLIVTNLSHGRPYILPHDGVLERLFFKRAELEAYLPKDVLDWMCTNCAQYQKKAASDPDPSAKQIQKDIQDLREISPENFPVILAARMSSGFPLLLSAVPLWCIDYDESPGEPVFQRCWFSDGGICSNFPIHLFDAALPSWPTFGMQLEDELPGPMVGDVYLPKAYEEGYRERWNRFGQDAKRPYPIFEFIFKIVETMQNWNDNTLSRVAGVRDRVVRVRLGEVEGGLNLNMEAPLITRIADRGERAAEALIERFAPASVNSPRSGWDEQRLIRFGVLLKLLNLKFSELKRSLKNCGPHATPYQELVNDAKCEPLPGSTLPLTETQIAAVEALIRDLQAFADTIDVGSLQFPFVPVPHPDLRVRPHV
jgi:predicted acylesterase/phospholipase RssA